VKAEQDRSPIRNAAIASLLLSVWLAGCTTVSSVTAPQVASLDAAQGSEENIASLTAVIERSPSDADAYNVRGTAYGRAGRNREALKDFDRAIELNPR